jgi:endonuclease G
VNTLITSAAFLLALTASLPAQHDLFGTPGCSGGERELADRTFFVLCHDADRKVPLWVGYVLTPNHLERYASRPSRFRQDHDLARPGAADRDYRGSGYSRGHMAPAADFAWSEDAIRATFLLSNAIPQDQRVNAGAWARIEAAVRRMAASADSAVIFTGPLFEASEARLIGQGRVVVPSHTYKVVLIVKGNRREMYAAIVPNAGQVKAGLETFTTNVDEVERRAGFDFFSSLDDAEEQLLETCPRPWR